jgi:hypothetical protein
MFWLSYVPDSVLTAVVVTLAVGEAYFTHRAEYMGGLRGVGVGEGFLLSFGLWLLIVLITLVVVIPMAVIRLLVRRHSPMQRLLQLAFPAVCLMALLSPIQLGESGAAVYLQGFERRMLARADIEAIQQWLATDGGKYAGREYRQDFLAELPKCLADLHPSVILFSNATAQHGVTVEFRWNAPHGENFGLVVGPPTMEIPKEGSIRLPDSSFNEFRRPIKRGAYVFARG